MGTKNGTSTIDLTVEEKERISQVLIPVLHSLKSKIAVEQFLDVSGHKADHKMVDLVRDLKEYVRHNPEVSMELHRNIRSGVLGVSCPLAEIKAELVKIYGSLKLSDSPIPTIAEGSAASGVRGRDPNTSFRFGGADPSDIDTLIVLKDHEFTQAYDKYLKSKIEQDPKFAAKVAKFKTAINKTEISILDIPSELGPDLANKGFSDLRQVRLEYDKGILRGKEMVKVGWVSEENIANLNKATKREVTVSLVKENSNFDPKDKVTANISHMEEPSMSTTHKAAVAAATVGVIIGIGALASGIVSICQDGVNFANTHTVVSSAINSLLGAKAVHEIAMLGEVSNFLTSVGGAVAVVDGIVNLVQGVRHGNGFRIAQGGVEIVAGGLILSGATAAGGLLLGGIVMADGIREIIEGSAVKGAFRTVGGGLLTAAAACTMIPGVGTVVAVGLGVAGAVALLVDLLVGLFSSKQITAEGPGAPPRAVRRRLMENKEAAYFGKWDVSVSLEYRRNFSALVEMRRESNI